ncbi:MAG: DUF454 family protein [Isosphaeraceae bacterium]
MLGNDQYIAVGTSIPEVASLEEEALWLRPIASEAVSAAAAARAVPKSPVGEPVVHEESARGLRIRCERKAGIVEIIDPRMFCSGKETFCRALCTSAASLGNASSVDLDLRAHRCRFQFEPEKFDEAELARRVALAIEAATLAAQSERSAGVKGWGEHARTEPMTPIAEWEEGTVTTRSDRCLCMALGGGSLMAAVAGLILPGIPTAPFLLFSAHYFLQSSTSFRRWLDGMPRLSELLRKLEESSGMAIDRAMFLRTIGMGILLGLVFLIVRPPFPLVLAIELAVTVFFGVHEIAALEALFEELAKDFA